MALSTAQIQLLALLATTHDYPAPKKWLGITPWNWRHVYEGQDGHEWGITHSGDIPESQKPWLTSRDVLPLFDAGLLASDYPDTKAAMSCFHITDAGRAALKKAA